MTVHVLDLEVRGEEFPTGATCHPACGRRQCQLRAVNVYAY